MELSHDVGSGSLFDVLVVVTRVIVAAILFPVVSDDLLDGYKRSLSCVLVLESED